MSYLSVNSKVYFLELVKGHRGHKRWLPTTEKRERSTSNFLRPHSYRTEEERSEGNRDGSRKHKNNKN